MQYSLNTNNDHALIFDNARYVKSQSYNLSFSYKESSYLAEQTSTHGQSKQLFFQSESVSLSFREKGHKVFEQAFNIGIRHESRIFASALPLANQNIDLPSPKDVSNRVLGFIENRLKQEQESGASQKELEKLMSQARDGVEKGFALARQDIDSLGLLDKELGEEIDKSFELISTGLNKLDNKYLAKEESLVDVSDKKAEQNKEHSKEPVGQPSTQVNTNYSKALVTLERYEASVSSEYNNRHDKLPSNNQYGLEYSSSVDIGSSFSLVTQDGDTVSIRFAEVDASYFKAHARSNSERYFFQNNQFSGYEISVQGDLDEGELLAIQELLEQTGKISDLFFSKNFQDAFIAAQNIGFDAAEIAEFSLDLSRVQVEKVRAYGNFEPSASSNAFKSNSPLIEIANRFEQSVTLLNNFQFQQIQFRELLIETIERTKESQEIAPLVSVNDFFLFAEKLSVLQLS